MKNVLQRTLTGALYILIIILSIVIHPIIFGVTTLVINYISVHEFLQIVEKKKIRLNYSVLILNTLFFFLSGFIIYARLHYTYLLVPFLILPLILMMRSLYKKDRNPVKYISFSFMGMLYISVPLILLNLIQQISSTRGISFTLSIFVIIWTNDTFAYLGGMAFGKHRLFERISPKKSWEGFFAGLVFSLIASMVFYYFFPSPGLINWLIVGFVTALSAVFGDLFESILKRSSGVKDSGSILPGHGGLLDRIDSLLFAVPAVFIYIMLILI